MTKKTDAFEVREDGLGWVERSPRTVGVARARDAAEALKWNASMLRVSPLFGRWFPKGVFKFRTWEEEEQWTRQQISKALSRRR